MAGESSSRSTGKRPFVEDLDDSKTKPPAKRVRFPKGKKVKPGDDVVIQDKVIEEEEPIDLSIPMVAAKERAKRRTQITAELFSEDDAGRSEVTSYEDNENFVLEGIQIEPFNLNKEREEGYFDAAGNFVEYVRENEIKDAWLDNVEVDPKYAALKNEAKNDEELVEDLSSKDIAVMKRRIANVLEPGETVLQALRRLKGSSDRKAKMSAETKIVFDQLTEDSMKLMENGEYNVYHEKKEVFEREAEGYEKLARAKGVGTSMHSTEGDANGEKDLASDDPNSDDFDMFADDDENATTKPSSDEVTQPSTAGALENDYVFDESSGYYYSSSLGYYYDPNTGLYCSAASGKWYSFNEQTNTYDEVPEVASTAS